MAEGFFRARKGLTVANSSASANLSPTTLTIGTTTGNSTGVYTGVVNATTVNSATFQVGTAFTANSVVTNAAAINITGQVNTATFFATTTANVGANVQLTTVQLKIGNTTANLIANSIFVSLANATSAANLNPNLLTVGNSTANVQANSTSIRVLNATASMTITAGSFTTPNVVITGVLSANGSVGTPGQILKTDGSSKAFWGDQSAANPAGTNKEVQINDGGSFGSNSLFTFDIPTSTLSLGNSTVSTTANNSLVKVTSASGSANLTPIQLAVGTSTVNSTVISTGSNVLISVADLKVGNSTVNVFANSTLVKVANSSGSANITPTNILVSNVTITGALSANGGVGSIDQILTSDGTKAYWKSIAGAAAAGDTGQIQYNASDLFNANSTFTFDEATVTLSVGNTTANVQSNTTQLKVANSTSSANLSPTALNIGISRVNATMMVVGSNLLISAADMKIGNSTANSTQNSVIFQVANSTSTANLDPIQLVIGTSKVNSTAHAVGANVLLETDRLFVGNASVNSITSATIMRLADSAGESTLTPTSITLGNTSANVQANGTSFRVVNSTSSANVDPSQLTIGISKVNSTMIAIGANVVVNSSVLMIGNGAVNIQINSSFFNGTANNANFLGGQAAVDYVAFDDLTGFQTEAGLAANVATLDANNATTALNANNASYLGGTTYLDYQLEAGLAGNVATLTANNTTWVGSVTVANVVSNAQLVANLALFQTSAGLSANVAKLAANNALFLNGVAAASYQTTAGLSANVALLTANNSNYLGGVFYTTYQTTTGLSGNVALLTANNANYLGGVAAASYLIASTADQSITGGARVTEYNIGTISAGGTVTPDPGDRPMQIYNANGAHTLAPGSNLGAYVLTITNGTSAGTMTTSGWTKVAGDTYATTSGYKFRCHCSIGAGGSLLVIQAMQ